MKKDNNKPVVLQVLPELGQGGVDKNKGLQTMLLRKAEE
jgi:hypothetical protein